MHQNENAPGFGIKVSENRPLIFSKINTEGKVKYNFQEEAYAKTFQQAIKITHKNNEHFRKKIITLSTGSHLQDKVKSGIDFEG